MLPFEFTRIPSSIFTCHCDVTSVTPCVFRQKLRIAVSYNLRMTCNLVFGSDANKHKKNWLLISSVKQKVSEHIKAETFDCACDKTISLLQDVMCFIYASTTVSSRNSNKHCRTPSAGEVPSLCCSASAMSSPGDQQALLAALQIAYVQVAAPWPCSPPSGELSQQYLISHKRRNQHLHKDNKATLSSPCWLQFSTRLVTVTLEQISVSALHEEQG